jgi:hypothetical protein
VLQVAAECATGAADLDFFQAEFTNAYSNLSNIVLKITPREAASQRAVLVNAHFDSSLGSPGTPPLRRTHLHQSCTQSASTFSRLVLHTYNRHHLFSSKEPARNASCPPNYAKGRSGILFSGTD